MSNVKSLVTKVAGTVGAATLIVGAFATSALAIDFTQVEPINISNSDPMTFISKIVTYALTFAGVIAVIYLIWGGISYITAGGDAEKAGKGRVAITNAIIGIIIIMASLVIYNAVTQNGLGF